MPNKPAKLIAMKYTIMMKCPRYFWFTNECTAIASTQTSQ